jgi:hypothetical protein
MAARDRIGRIAPRAAEALLWLPLILAGLCLVALLVYLLIYGPPDGKRRQR